MADNTEEGLPILKKKTADKTEDGLPVLKKKEPTPSPSPSEDGTSPSTTGVSGQPNLSDINTDINAGVFQPPTEPLVRPNEPAITIAPTQDLSAATAPTYATTKEVNIPGTTLSESAKALQAGVATVGAIVARTPAYTNDFINRATNTLLNTNFKADLANQPNALAENFEQIAKNASAESNKDYTDEKGNLIGAYDYLKKGEVKKGLGKLMNNVIEALPVSAAIVGASAAGVPATGIAAGGAMAFGAQEKQNLLKQNEENKKAGLPTMSEEDINAVSLISGTLEGTVDAAFGNVKFAQFYKDLVKKEGEEAAKKAIEPTVKEILKKGLGRYLGTVSEEAAAEGATQYLDNLNHIVVGGDTQTRPWDNVMESVLTGAGSAGALGAPIIPHTALQAAITRADQKIAQQRKEQADALKSVIESPFTAEETKKSAQEALSRNQQEDEKHAQELLDKHNKLPESKKTEVNNLLYKQSKSLEAAHDPMLAEEQRDSFLADAEQANKQVEDIYKENEKLLEEKAKATEKEKKAFEKQELPTEEYKPEEYADETENLFKEIEQEEVKEQKKKKPIQPKEEPTVTDEFDMANEKKGLSRKEAFEQLKEKFPEESEKAKVISDNFENIVSQLKETKKLIEEC